MGEGFYASTTIGFLPARNVEVAICACIKSLNRHVRIVGAANGAIMAMTRLSVWTALTLE